MNAKWVCRLAISCHSHAIFSLTVWVQKTGTQLYISSQTVGLCSSVFCMFGAVWRVSLMGSVRDIEPPLYNCCITTITGITNNLRSIDQWGGNCIIHSIYPVAHKSQLSGIFNILHITAGIIGQSARAKDTIWSDEHRKLRDARHALRSGVFMNKKRFSFKRHNWQRIF